MPGDFTPPSRFLRATVFGATAIPSETADQAILQVFQVLNNFDIPLGVVPEEAGGVVHSDLKQVTTARDRMKVQVFVVPNVCGERTQGSGSRWWS
ncbi:MAG: linear amide C-N hydrolase [Acidobacteriota bacterium]